MPLREGVCDEGREYHERSSTSILGPGELLDSTTISPRTAAALGGRV
jgi:hypothetical protein